uniref:Cell death abnormality protein 1-like n=1 Tax=Crassostrea virginica TaxID=6565 RepID=A0A8B8BK02_CRAVI|nr:cell death abnormality protein 1-like [Crassostrea virginica]
MVKSIEIVFIFLLCLQFSLEVGACETGFNGSSCDQQCPYPSYGLNCASKCNCIYKDCHHQYGCNKSTGDIPGTLAKSHSTEKTITRRACETGFNGSSCDQQCPYPLYGLNCASRCNCIYKDCHHQYGCNKSTGDIPGTLAKSHSTEITINRRESNTMATMSFLNEKDKRTTCSNIKGRQPTRMSNIVSLTIALAVLALVILVLYLYVNTIQRGHQRIVKGVII